MNIAIILYLIFASFIILILSWGTGFYDNISRINTKVFIFLVSWFIVSSFMLYPLEEVDHSEVFDIFSVDRIQVIIIGKEVMNVTDHFGKMFDSDTHQIKVVRYNLRSLGIEHMFDPSKVKHGFHEFEAVDKLIE